MISLPNVSDHAQLKYMWRLCSTCFWCGKETKVYTFSNCKKGFFLPGNTATRDHLFSKSDIRRLWYKNNKKSSPFVLSCYQCNHNRGDTKLEESLIIKKREINFENDFIYYKNI